MKSYIAQFQREKTALKYYLMGRNYSVALKALGFAEKYHLNDGDNSGKITKFRKDGKTPEFHHQIQIALSLIQERDILEEEVTITAIILHDVMEDYDIAKEEIEKEFGSRIADITWKLTKKHRGEIKTTTMYYKELAGCHVSSIAKGLDRINNLSSMLGVFSIAKIVAYIRETESFVLPMLKEAQKQCPSQQIAYSSIAQKIKMLLNSAKKYAELHTKTELDLNLLKTKMVSSDQELSKAKKDLHTLKESKVTEILNFAKHQSNPETTKTSPNYASACKSILNELVKSEITVEQKVKLGKMIMEKLSVSELQLTEFENYSFT